MEKCVASVAGRRGCERWNSCVFEWKTTKTLEGYEFSVKRRIRGNSSSLVEFRSSNSAVRHGDICVARSSRRIAGALRTSSSGGNRWEGIGSGNFLVGLEWMFSGRSVVCNRQWDCTSVSLMPGARAGKPVEVLVNPDSENKRLLAEIPVLKESYNRPLYLSNGHVETIFAAFFRTLPKLKYKRECLRMEDGGTVSLDWAVGGDPENIWREPVVKGAPVLVVLPGLSGGSHDDYVRYMLIQARKCGWRGVVFNSRGCADSPVTSAQFYSASHTEDLRQAVKHVGSLYRKSRIYAAGWSLGANILVRYMGEDGDHCPLAGAVSLCNPFDLVLCDHHFQRGFNVVYDRFLAKALGKIFARNALLFEEIGGDFDVALASKAKSIRDFDNGITRVSFGFKTVDDYYKESGSFRMIKDIKQPLLCIQAVDDPIAVAAAIPRADIEANVNCALIVTPGGGHLGWIAGPNAPFGASWTDLVVMEYLKLLDASVKSRPAFEEADGQVGNVELVGVEARKD